MNQIDSYVTEANAHIEAAKRAIRYGLVGAKAMEEANDKEAVYRTIANTYLAAQVQATLAAAFSLLALVETVRVK